MDLETQTSEPMDTTEEEFDLFAEDDSYPQEDAEQTSEADDLGNDQEQETEVEGVDDKQQPIEQGGEALLDVVYNGQPMQLTREQAVTLAQKGMNYDKKVQELETLRNAPERQLLEKLARQSGMDYGQFLANFEQQIEQSALNSRAQEIMQDGYTSPEVAMRTAKAEMENERMLNIQRAQERQKQAIFQQAQQRKQAEAERKQRFNQEIAEIVKENPEFPKQYPTVESMPKVMQEAILGGKSIMQAYQQVVIENLRNENAAYKQNQINKEQSPGSASSTSKQGRDVFITSLFGDD